MQLILYTLIIDEQVTRIGSMAKRVKASFLQRPCDHYRLIYVQLSLSLHCFAIGLDRAIYDDYPCLVASNKQKTNWEEVKESAGKLKNQQLLS